MKDVDVQITVVTTDVAEMVYLAVETAVAFG